MLQLLGGTAPCALEHAVNKYIMNLEVYRNLLSQSTQCCMQFAIMGPKLDKKRLGPNAAIPASFLRDEVSCVNDLASHFRAGPFFRSMRRTVFSKWRPRRHLLHRLRTLRPLIVRLM